MKTNMTFRHNQGFSMVEVLATSLILAIGLIATAKLQVDIVQNTTRSQQQVEAVNLAKSLIEQNLHISTAKQFDNLVANGGGHNTTEKTSANFLSAWAINKGDNGRSANVTMNISWDQSESIFLSTILSNTTPAALTMTSQAPPRNPAIDPPLLPLVFPAVDPANPSNTENICRCNGSTAVAFNETSVARSNFVKVSGDGGGNYGDWYDHDNDGADDDSSEQVPVSGATAECNLCCESANAAAKADLVEKYYAKLEKQFMKKVRYEGDQVIGNNGFDPRYLLKGFKTNDLQEDIKKFLSKASGDGDYDWSSWGDGDKHDDSDHDSFTFTASCGFTYDPPPPPTVEEPKPKPVPKSTRCIYYRGNKS